MDLRLSSVIILTKSLLSSSNSQTFKRSLVYFVFSACYKLSLLSHSVQPIAPVVAIFLRSKSFASKQGKQDSSRCNSGGCIPAHKCQQSRTDILDFWPGYDLYAFYFADYRIQCLRKSLNFVETLVGHFKYLLASRH